MGKQPKLVKEIPKGYEFSHKDEVTGKDIYKISSSKSTPEGGHGRIRTDEKKPTVTKSANKVPNTIVPKSKTRQSSVIIPPTTNPTEDYVMLDESKPEVTPTQKVQSLRTDLTEEFPNGLESGYRSFRVPDLNTGGNYAKQKNVITDKDGMPVIYDFKQNKYIQTGEPNIHLNMPVQNDTPTIQDALAPNELPTKFDVVPERLRVPSYNKAKVTTPTVDTTIYKGFNDVGVPNNTNTDAEFQKEQEKNLAVPKLKKGGIVSNIKGYYTGGDVDENGNPYLSGNPNIQNQGQQFTNTGNAKTSDNFYSSFGAEKGANSGVIGQADVYGKAKADEEQKNKDEKDAKNSAMKSSATNAITSGLGAYGKSYALNAQDTGSQDSATKSAMGAVSNMGAIGGVVAGAYGIVDGIARPEKNKAEKMDITYDSQGNATAKLKSTDKAKDNAIIGSFLSPSEALTTRMSYEGGLTDISGYGYTKHLEKEAQKQLDVYNKANQTDKQNQAVAAREAGNLNASINTMYNLRGTSFNDAKQLEGVSNYKKGGIVSKIQMCADGGKIIKDIVSVNESTGKPYNKDISDAWDRQNNSDTKKYYQSFSKEGLTEKEYFDKYPNEAKFYQERANDKIKNRHNPEYQNNLYAKGGVIKGKGTGTSDSILAKVEADSFVVPKKYAEEAEEIREKYLGKPPKSKANLNQKGGEKVKLSNGEHLYTPEEKHELLEKGVNVDLLAPKSEVKAVEKKSHIMFPNVIGMATGGDVPEDTIDPKKEKERLAKEEAEIKKSKDYTKSIENRVDVAKNIKKHRDFTQQVLIGTANRKAELEKEYNRVKNGENADYKGADAVRERLKTLLDEIDTQTEKAKTTAKEYELSKNDSNYDISGNFKPISVINDKNNSSNTSNSDLKFKKKGKQSDKTYDELIKKPNHFTGTDADWKKAVDDSIAKGDTIPKGGTIIPKATSSSSGLRVPKSNKIVVADNLPTKDLSLAGLKQEAELKANAAAIDADKSIANAPTRQAVINDANKANNDAYVSSNPTQRKGGIMDKIGNINPTSLIGIGQMALGKNMLSDSKRPVDKAVLDATYNANVNRSLEDAKFGLTPEQRFAAEQDIQNSLNDAKAVGLNYSGGSGVQAFNTNRAAINDAWKAKLGLKVADTDLRMQKQKYADAMAADRASILASNRRQAFNDAMGAFNQNQQSGSELVGAGIQNAIGAYRFNKIKKQQDELDNERNIYGNA